MRTTTRGRQQGAHQYRSKNVVLVLLPKLIPSKKSRLVGGGDISLHCHQAAKNNNLQPPVHWHAGWAQLLLGVQHWQDGVFND
jgi:hypothetical protein